VALVEKKPITHNLYANIPNDQGEFKPSFVHTTETEGSIFYKFMLFDGNKNRATFEFNNSENTCKDAISNPELILEPACNILGSSNYNAKKIITRTPGEVEKQNENWVVVKKAEILYE